MDLTAAMAAAAAEEVDCPTCDAPAGSPCRTRAGRVAVKYHIPRFLQVQALRDEHEVEVPADRGPGRPWQPGPAPRVVAPARIGYAYDPSSVAEVHRQTEALLAAGCRRVFGEQVGIRVRTRPELDKSLEMAADLGRTGSDRVVLLAVYDLGRLARTSAELLVRAALLRAAGVGVEVLTGPLAGIHQPTDGDVTLFTVLAAADGLDRQWHRAATLAGQDGAGGRGGRPRVFDDTMIAQARKLRDEGLPVPEIARRLTIRSGRNAGRHPSIASVYRALAESSTEMEYA